MVAGVPADANAQRSSTSIVLPSLAYPRGACCTHSGGRRSGLGRLGHFRTLRVGSIVSDDTHNARSLFISYASCLFYIRSTDLSTSSLALGRIFFH